MVYPPYPPYPPSHPFLFGEDYFVNHMLKSSVKGSEWYQKLSLDGVEVNFKLDSGATCNILPYEFYSRLPKQCQRLRPGPTVRS
jgi:hypothetical protein